MSDDAQQGEQQLTPVRRSAASLSGRALKDLADSGGFTVDENTGDQMINALEEMLDALERRWAEIEKLGTAPPLSTSSTGKWVAQHTLHTASDERGMLTQLRAAREELPQYIEAIRAAKRAYAGTESGVRTDLDGLSPA